MKTPYHFMLLYQQVMHQLESLTVMYPGIQVMLDTSQVTGYDPAVFKTELDFFTQYRQHLKKIAIVTGGSGSQARLVHDPAIR